MNSQSNLFTSFLNCEKTRLTLQLPPSVLEQLQFQQYFIRRQYNNPHPSNKSSINTTTELFTSFSTLSKPEMISFYVSKIHLLTQLASNKIPPPPSKTPNPYEFYLRTNHSKTWKRTFLTIIPKNLVFEIQKKDVKKVYSLCHYIPRKFKCTDYFSFALESTSHLVKEKYATLYFGFTKADVCEAVYQEMKKGIQYCITLRYARELGLQLPSATLSRLLEQESKDNTSPPNSPTLSFQPSSPKKSNKKNAMGTESLGLIMESEELAESKIISQIIEESVLLEDIEEIEDPTSKPTPHLINQLIPNYRLQDIQSEQQMKSILCEGNYRILQHKSDKKRFKMFLSFQSKPEQILTILTNINHLREWNQEIESIDVKNIIKTENSAVMYMKLKNYNKIYRGRDFLYLRHAFVSGDTIYIVDKSISNLSYPPFMTIVRGEYTGVTGLIKGKEKDQILVVMDITMDHLGIINEEQNTNLTVKYLVQFGNIKRYLESNLYQKHLNHLFDFQLVPIKAQQKLKKVAFESPPKNHLPKSEKVISKRNKEDTSIKKQSKSMKRIEESVRDQTNGVQKNNQYQIHINQPSHSQTIPISKPNIAQQEESKSQIKEKQEDLGALAKLKTNYLIPQLDNQGNSITNWGCLKHKFKMVPWARPMIYDQDYKEHHVWKGEWKHDDKEGGLFYKDQEKMNAQKKVLGYVLKKIGTNIFQGKGITSISLPVDIFSTESNLEKVARTFAYAPIILEPVANIDNPVEQLKSVVILSITHSSLYVMMEKPFNPVLGETFQGSINGCPIYMEQVSHHPPIASFYFIGRGYKIYGSIESKMNIGMNSGTGTNDGDFKVQFQNGTIIKFRTAGGEISGLTFGDRKLNLVGKGYFWSPNKHLMLEVTYNPNKKGMFAIGKQKTPSDFFSGNVCKVTKQAITKFQKQKTKSTISKLDILEELCRVQGVWTGDVIMDGKVVFNIDRQKYIKFQYQPNPLPSDANYREDIIYRRLMDYVRSQAEKEKIEDKQRKDRKHREKIHGVKH